jgi:hypothetical protein
MERVSGARGSPTSADLGSWTDLGPPSRPGSPLNADYTTVNTAAPASENGFTLLFPPPETTGGMKNNSTQTETDPRRRRRPRTRGSAVTKLADTLRELLQQKGKNFELNEEQVQNLIDAVSPIGETLKSGKGAIEGVLREFSGASEKGRNVIAKGKALFDTSSNKAATVRGKEFASAVKSLITHKVIKYVGISVLALTALVVFVAVVCAAATYPILKAAIKNGTAAGNQKSLGASGTAPLVYTLPPAYGSIYGSAAKNNNNSQYSQYG